MTVVNSQALSLVRAARAEARSAVDEQDRLTGVLARQAEYIGALERERDSALLQLRDIEHRLCLCRVSHFRHPQCPIHTT